jgi:hypothetical protein
MIRVDRRRVPAPPSLAAAGVAERDRAVALYADPDNKDAPFAFAAYKARDVVEALTALFRGKCAYCESSYAPVTPVDIEHFRPKGAIAVDDGSGGRRRSKPGYYWLAAEWDNLLPSCPDCNRARTHEFPDDDGDDDLTEVGGKENQFPLVSEARRGTRPGEERTLEGSQRLLLHPCRDQPERHLEFLASGVVRERAGSRKGKASIAALALRRAELNEARRAHLEGLAEKMRTILWFVEDLERDANDTRAKERIRVLTDELHQATRDDRVYAAMSRQYIAAFERSLLDGTVRAFVQRLLSDVTSPLR